MRFTRLFRAARNLTTVPFLLAALLATMVPANATPPVFNGDLVSATKPMYDVRFYGAKCDGATDDSNAIQSAITAAQGGSTEGGIVLLPAGTCMAHGLQITANNILLMGMGDAFDRSSITGSTTLDFNGSAGGTLLTMTPPGGCVTNCFISGGGLSNVSLSSNSASAAIGLLLVSVQGAVFDRISGDAFTESWIETKIFAGGNQSDMHNMFKRLNWVNQSNSGNAIWLKVANFNTFDDLLIQYNNNVAIRLGGGSADANAVDTADFNRIVGVHGIRQGGGTGSGITFDCGSYSNELDHISDPAIIARGTTTCTGTLHYTFANVMHHFDKCDDGLAAPTIETGAYMSYDDDCGDRVVSALSANVAGLGVTQQYNSNILGTYGATTLNPWFYFGQMNADNVPILIGNKSGVSGITQIGANSTASCNGVAGTVFWANNYGSQGMCFSGTALGLSASGSWVQVGTGGYIFSNGDTGTAQTQITKTASTLNGISGIVWSVSDIGHGLFATMDGSGNLGINGKIAATGHNACSATSGVPCESTMTCSLSAATTCNATVTVPTSSICTASGNGSDTTTGTEAWYLSLSTNTLTVTARVSASQTTTAAANVTCL